MKQVLGGNKIEGHVVLTNMGIISKKLEDKYTELGQDKFSRKLDFEAIYVLFQDKEFFFIPHAGSDNSIAKAYSDSLYSLKMVLLLPSALEKVSKEETKRIYNNAFDDNLIESLKCL
jgi:hypothetical protein